MQEHRDAAETDVNDHPDTDVSGAWDADNQAWWDWYVSLADNDDEITEFEAAVPLPDIPLPDDDVIFGELAEPYDLTAADIAFFQENGFIKLKGVFSPGAMLRLRALLIERLTAEFGSGLDGCVRHRFLSLEMIWQDHPLLHAFVLSPRVAKICADLLRVPAVRLYHDNVLSKEPGCGRTPWHFDDHHFPLDTHDVVTAWGPCAADPAGNGAVGVRLSAGRS